MLGKTLWDSPEKLSDFARHLLINFCESGADQSLALQSNASMESPGNGMNYIKYIYIYIYIK